MFRSLSVRVPMMTMRRTFATSGHEPPKKLYGPTGRYAMATYVAASKAGAKEKVEAELQAFAEVLKKNPSLEVYLANPTIPRPTKAAKVAGLLDESKFSSVTRNLFSTLSLNGRIGQISKVISEYQELMTAARGAVQVTVISAEALKKKQLETIQAAVAKMLGAGKTVEMATQVDPNILSGLQVLIDDRFLDLSVSSRIKQLTHALDTSTP